MKKRFFIVAILIVVLALSLMLVACNKEPNEESPTDGRVPVYQGMTISRDLSMASSPRFAPSGGKGGRGNKKPGDYYGDHKGRNEDLDQDLPFEDDNLPTIEEKVESTLQVIGSADKIYYADKNQDIYITIKLSNPDSYEIMSFTLNGNKYSSYMFEQGSDMENLILKLNVGNAAGIVDYTIDAIKYIDGTDIKDVIMDGDKTVKVGIRASDQTYVNVTNESVSLTEIKFTAHIVDLYSLIEKSGGYAKAVLYDGTNLVSKDIATGEQVAVIFNNLSPSTLYQYGIVAYYDNLSGTGAELNILYKNAVYTNTIVLFDNITVGKTFASWDYNWDSGASDKTITALSLWQNGSKIMDLSPSDKTVEGLHTNNEYTIKAQHNNLKGEKEEIELSFITLANVVPAMSIKNVETTQDSISFGIDIIDVDNVGKITAIELYQGETKIEVLDNLTDREFIGLLSNNAYTVRATYTYDLNDGVGVQTIVKTKDCSTLAKSVPTVSITDVETTQDSISFGIDIIDVDNVGEITAIELYQGETKIEVLDNLTDREFIGLLSNNDYTIKITYTYDLSDGVGVQTIVKTKDCSTLAKSVPTVSITDVETTQDSISFGIDIIDVDNVGEITAIELYQGETKIEVLDNLTDREFIGLLSNNDYTIKITYTYDLSDGVGVQTIVKTKDCSTLAKSVPTVSITDVETTQDSISFGIDIIDVDNVGSLTKIELLHDSDTPIVASGIEIREFTGLLSNNAYTVRATYTYDLNDGEGEHTIVKTADVQTLAKATPNIDYKDIDISYNGISFDLEYTDIDNVGEIESIKLYKSADFVAETDIDDLRFAELDSYQSYTITVEVTYDLNDGIGNRSKTFDYAFKTHPYFAFTGTEVLNTSAVSLGEEIVLQANLNNPDGAKYTEVKINGRWYTVSTASTDDKMRVSITAIEEMGGGNIALVVEEIKLSLDGNSYRITLDGNNTSEVFINGELYVTSLAVVNEDGDITDYAMPSDNIYLLVTLTNPTEYDVNSITIYSDYNDTVYSSEQITQIDNNTIKIQVNPSYGWRSYSVKIIKYSNDYLTKEKAVDNITTSVLRLYSDEIKDVSTAQDLKNMGGSKPYYYKLTNDIDLKDNEWSSAGDFYGYFDGGGYSIKNMRVVKTFENQNVYLGLFKTANGVVDNLHLEDVLFMANITSTSDIEYDFFAGGIASRLQERLFIYNTSVTGSIAIASKGYSYAGGLIGEVSSGSTTITNSYSTGNISAESTSSSTYAGGLIGRSSGSTTITNSYNTGDISGSSAGGLIGEVVSYGSGSTTITITNSYSTGNISAESTSYHTYAGGLIGRSSGSTTITNSYNTGDISGSSAGGLIGEGESYGSTTITNSYNTGDISGSSAGGLIGEVVSYGSGSTTITNSYSTGDISGSSAGGLIGEVVSYGSGSTTITITNSYSTGDISGSSAGGLIGEVVSYGSGSTTITITNSYSTGNISAESTSYHTYAGGLIGEVSYGSGSTTITITNSYSTGNISAESTSYHTYAGGLIGRSSGSTTITNSYNTGDISGSYTGGLVGDAETTITITNCYSIASDKYALPVSIVELNSIQFYTEILDWSTDIWDFSNLDFENNKYPKLKY